MPPHIRRESGVVFPHDRVFRLQLAHDPTMGEGPQDSSRPRAAPEPTSRIHLQPTLAPLQP